MRTLLTICTLSLLALAACNKKGGMDPKPKISFKNITESVKRGDSISISFAFEDGDADIEENAQVVIIDSRDTAKNEAIFPFPRIFDGFLDPQLGIKGSVLVVLGRNYTRLKDTTQAEKATFEVFMKDAAGNASNRITTPEVTIEP